MPFSLDLEDEEEKKKAEQEQQASAAPAMTSGGESFGSGQFKSGAQSEKGAQGQGSGFVSLDKYFNANKSSGFGNQVTGKVQGSIDSAKQDLQAGSEAFSNASNQGTTRWNDVEGQVKGIVQNAGDQTSQDDVSRVRGLADAQYRGPESFMGTAYGSKAQGSVDKARQQGKALQSEGGRFALLDQYYGRPNYSMGEKSLDNLLVQNTPGVAARSQTLGTQAKQVEGQAGQVQRDMNTLAAMNRQATQDAAKNTRETVSGAVGGFKDDLSKRYADYGSGLDAYNQARSGDISDDTWDAETLGLFGLNGGENLYNLDASTYLQENPKAALGEFASDEDYAKYLALSQLAGEDPTFLSAADRAKAGTGADKGRIGVNREAFQRDLADVGGRYSDSMADIKSTAEAAIDDWLGSTTTPQSGGTADTAIKAIRSMDLAKMEAALANYGDNTEAQGAKILKATIDAIKESNGLFNPTRKLQAGGA